MDGRVLAVFDSGLGSISVIKELMRETNENIVYLADRKHHPYGLKNIDSLRYIISQSIKYLTRYDPKLIVVASVTPTLTVLNELILYNRDIPIFGVYLPLDRAVKLSKDITILCTKALSSKVRDMVVPYLLRSNIKIIEVDNVIKCIEENCNIEQVNLRLDSKVVLLGSTHLSLVKDMLESIYRDSIFIDGINDTVNQVKNYLINHDILNCKGGLIRILVSKDLESFKPKALKLLQGYNLSFEEVDLPF